MRLERMLRPKSIAAIGGLQAGRVVEQCRLMGFEGEIWPVHPSKSEVHGVKAYATLADLPGAPDAAFIGVNRNIAVDVIRELRDMGCGGGVCFAAGFLEADETGAKLQGELVEAAGDMPILGPNCYGYINYADGALLWPDQQGGKRLEANQSGVAIIAQSSNIAINFTMQKRGLPLSYVFTVGNQALVGISEIALNLLEDPRVSTIGIYIEGFDSVPAFEELARRARAKNKPVVIFNVGRSEQSRATAMSHTASLLGSHAIVDAFLERNGFGIADSIPSFLESLKLLHIHGPLPGYRISSMSCSGGEASIIADAARKRKVFFPPLDAAQAAPVQKALGPLVAVANPLDYHTYCWGNREVMQAAYTAMTANGYDMNYLVLDFPHAERCDDWEWHIAVDAFEAALSENGARGAFVVGMPENIPESYTEDYNRRGIVSFYGIDEALHATEIAADIGVAWQRTPAEPLLPVPRLQGPGVALDEDEAKRLLAEHAVPVPPGARVESYEQASKLAAQIGYPVVLKALGIAHKTEHDAVRLNLADEPALAAAAAELFELGDALYLEAMKPALVELIVGIMRDPSFGLALTIGSGGILVEVLQDSVTLLIPATRPEITDALQKLRSAPLLNGFRSRPPADIDATVDAILAIQQFAIAHSASLLELDVNPLLVGARGEGVFAADALIVLQEQNHV